MKLRIKHKSYKNMTLYYLKDLSEFCVTVSEFTSALYYTKNTIVIATFDDKGECEVKINKIDLFKYKLLAKNFLSTFVEVIK